MIFRQKDTLLLVGDGSSERKNLSEILGSHYNILEAESALQAKHLFSQNSHCIAAVLADIPIDQADDIISLANSCTTDTEQDVPLVLLIPSQSDVELEEQAFRLGATDIIQKPYSAAGLVRRLNIMLHVFLQKWNLEQQVSKQNETLRTSNQNMLNALSTIIEYRSTESGNHVLRIRKFTKILLEQVAKSHPEYRLTPNMIETIVSASALHDIGKISVSDTILNKPDKFTEEEYAIMKTHTLIGAQMIQSLSMTDSAEYLRYAYNIALYHHERWDGHGYPHQLKSDDIPICAQVVGLADAFDALTTPRSYKPAYSSYKAFHMLLNGESGVFSPQLLECLKAVRDQLVEAAKEYADGHSPKMDEIALPLPKPVRETPELNSQQLSQMKYQALLHHGNATVIEMDPAHNFHHIVYNPNPDFDMLRDSTTLEDFFHQLSQAIHPDDKEQFAVMKKDLYINFMEQGLRKKSFSLRIYSPVQSCYRSYQPSLLRVDTHGADQTLFMLILRPAADENLREKLLPLTHQASTPEFHGMSLTKLSCYYDSVLTLVSCSELYTLTGYQEKDIQENFGGSLMEFIYPDDRQIFRETLQTAYKTGEIVELEYRLLRKEKKPLWVHSKNRITANAHGESILYTTLSDNSHNHAIIHQLESTVRRNELIINESDIILFDWDFSTDELVCSAKWEEHFGYTPITHNYKDQLGITTHFHPDDLPTVRAAIEQLRKDQNTISAEVRIANASARYLWTKIIATANQDENGDIIGIVGIIQNIDVEKRAEISLREKAEQDSLTKLLNKASSQQQIIDYLNQTEKEPSALLLLDLDNFKTVNDTYGHLYGDELLLHISNTLKQLFRSNDIIGRIGGDEFLVFMRNIPSEELIHSRCNQLLKSFNRLFMQLTPDLNVSCSIGVAMSPIHGSTYADLFRHADHALYLCKSSGKNAYHVYDPKEIYVTLPENTRVATDIDSDEDTVAAQHSFVNYIFHKLYDSNDILQTLDDILAYIGDQLRISRVYVFENSEDNRACSNTLEWCGEGISPQKDNLQNLNYELDIPGWKELFEENGSYFCSDISTMAPNIRAILEPQGIKSILLSGIYDHGVFRGFMGFDECSSHRMWTQDQLNMLRLLAEIISVFLLKKRSQDKAILLTEKMQ